MFAMKILHGEHRNRHIDTSVYDNTEIYYYYYQYSNPSSFMFDSWRPKLSPLSSLKIINERENKAQV